MAGPFTVVLLDAAYVEVARADAIGTAHYEPGGAIAAALAAGRVFHWYVEATSAGRLHRSLLETFELR